MTKKRELARTITINLLDFIYFPSSKYEQIVKLNKNNRFVKNEELELVVIELPKFNEKNILECNTKEEWITYLKGNNNKLIEKIKNQNKYIKNLDYLLEKYWKEEKME
ncbi:MAG: PD-(D/E)XK nuclease family transposase [Clostridia bacterium]